MSTSLRVGYFGPAGTHTHVAARALFPDAEYVPFLTIRAVIDAVQAKAVNHGVVPIENSTEGGVSSTLDGLFETEVKIRGELVLEIAQYLSSKATEIASIQRVYSHPQALAQCARWLAAHLPEAEQIAAASTSAAAALAAAEPTSAAIGATLAAELHQLNVLAAIQDRTENATRFAAVSLEDSKPSGNDKTSIVFSTKHERGALRRALEVFDLQNINLSRIESRPAAGLRWEYVFFIDVEGHRSDEPIRVALERLTRECGTVRVLGSYPRAQVKLK